MKQFRKDKIRMYAFLTACLIVLILLNTVGVFAFESFNLITRFNITEDDLLNQEDYVLSDEYISGTTMYCSQSSNSYTNTVNYINNGLYNFDANSISNTDSEFFTDLDYFTFANNDNVTTVFFGDENTFVGYISNVYYIYYPKDLIDSYISSVSSTSPHCFLFRFQNGLPLGYFSVYQSLGSTIYNIDGNLYYRTSFGDYSACRCSNMPIYYNGGNDITTLNGIDNLNYSSLDDVSTSGESELNNLYFPTSDFKWRVESYGISYNWPSSDLSSREFAQQALSNADRNMLKKSNWGSGAVDFTAVPTDYQKEHSDEFYIKFKFMCWMKYFTPTPLTAVEGSSWKGYYIFATNPFEVDVPLSTFINNGNIKTFNMADIFSNLSITSTNTDFNTTIQGAYSQLREEEYLLWDNSTDLGWKLQASAQIYPTDSNLNENSGFNTETYNFITQISKQTEDSLSDNEYPYSSDDETNENTPDIGGGNNSQSVTSDNGQITLTNNDNDVININDGNADVVEDIYNDLTVSDGEDSLSQRFVDIVNENAWITIMQETFSFIPSTIWVSLEIFVVTALGILAASFVLRIILDLL